MSDEEQPEYNLTVEQVAARLNLSIRSAHRYAESKRLRTRRAGRRVLFHAGDVEALARDLDIAASAPPAPQPKQELVPAGQLLDYLKERDRHLAEAQARHEQALLEIGRLRGLLETYKALPEDVEQLRGQLDQAQQDLATLQAERDELRQRLEQAQKPSFWKRFFGGE
jgi:excisionase family DNA binding protein